MPAKTLTVGEFKDEVYNRLGGEISKAEISRVLRAVTEEVGECVAAGYKVALPGLARFEPRFVPAKKKGEMVTPFGGGDPVPRAASVPATFKVKGFASSSLGKNMPGIRTKAGQNLEALLAAPVKKAAPAAKGKTSTAKGKAAGAKGGKGKSK